MSEDTQVTNQETSNLEATPALDTTTSAPVTPNPTDTSKPEGATAKTEDNWEYDGNRNAVPDSFKKYATGFDRYVSKITQSRSELEKKVREYEEKISSFSKSNTEKSDTGTPTPQAPLVTQEESEAIMLGDTSTLQKVIEREVKRNLETNITPKEEAINQKLNAMDMRQKEIDAAEVIKSFSDVNPDFTELINSPVGNYMIEAARKGMSLEDIYKSAKTVEEHFLTVAETKRKAELEKKKNGTVVGKSVPGTPDIVYANDENHAKRLAIELTLKGDKRHVRIKPKK